MGEKLGRYELIETLGRGAVGTVYKARDPLIGRIVAIKSINLLAMAPEDRDRYKTRFYQEAKAAGALTHPNIITIHDMGETEENAFIAMEFMEGQDLEHNKRHTLDQILDIGIQAAAGLHYAHEHGVIHRDIKPANIMLLKDRQVKICDFGIAKVTTPLLQTKIGSILGSPLYMSPEQVLGKPLDNRSDIFSLGIVLYELITDNLPFSGDNSTEAMGSIVNAPFPPASSIVPGLPPMLDDILSKCLEKKPADRYKNAEELEQDLRACRGMVLQAETGADHMKHFYQKHPTSGRQGMGRILLILVLLALAGFGAYALILHFTA